MTALWLCLALCGAYLTKGVGLLFLVLPLAAAVLVARGPDGRIRAAAWGVGAALIAFLVTAGVQQLGRLGGQGTVLPSHDPVLLAFDAFSRLGNIQRTLDHLGTYVDILATYSGWPVLAAAGVGVIWLTRRSGWQAATLLLIPAGGFGLALALSDPPNLFRTLEVRYVLITAPWIAALAGLSAAAGRLALAQFNGIGRMAAVGILVIVLAGPALYFDALVITRPSDAPLARLDRVIYTDLAPVAHRDLAAAILAAHQPQRELHIFGESTITQAYLGAEAAHYYPLYGDNHDRDVPLAVWRIDRQGGQALVIEDTEWFAVPEHRYGTTLTLLEGFEAPRGVINLYQLEAAGIDSSATDALYAWLSPPPAELEGGIEGVAAALAARPAAGSILAFPSVHAATIQAASGRRVLPLSVPAWPLDAEDAQAALAPHLPAEDAAPVQIILIDEAMTDPNRGLLLALERELYRVEEGWYGLTHHLTYLSGLRREPWQPAGAYFEDAIVLDAAAVLDPQPEPGGAVRLALRWKAGVLIQDSFAVFVHIIARDGSIGAQHDSVPGHGLYPMTDWVPGELVTERLAIRLPAGLAAGHYQIRVGIYNPASGLRLPVTDRGSLTGEAAGDYVAIGTIEVGRP